MEYYVLYAIVLILAHNTVHGTNINKSYISFTKDNTFQRFVIYGDELKKQNKFLERVEQYYSKKNLNFLLTLKLHNIFYQIN